MIPRYVPMLASPWPEPFSDPDWLFEVKWDGIRALLYWDGTAAVLRSRRGRDFTSAYPEISIRSGRPCVVDGEIIALDASGRPSFGQLQKRMNLTGSIRVKESMRTNPVTMMAFDLLYDGDEILREPIEARRGRLETVGFTSAVAVSEAVYAEGEALFAAAGERELEGIVAKRLGSAYRPGVRSPDWRKIPRVRSIRAVVAGFTAGERGRSSTFGSLVLGLWHDGRLRWIGSVGTGFTDQALLSIREALDAISTPGCPFLPDPDLPAATWVVPRLVARVEFREWTGAGRLRAPSFKGLSGEPVEEITWQVEGPGEVR